ncbi:MAG TPA: alanine racemase, partial [Ilumatobacteraceae bacterium]|nr:alanine racemase [Ilumatobacteraceae bacterium]
PAIEAVANADAIQRSPATRLAGVFTHLAKADEPDDPFTNPQLAAFDAALDLLDAAGHRPPMVHAANSAGLIAHPAARFTMVRAGIAIYGIAPSTELAAASAALRPALSLHARVSMVKRLEAGDGVSYGQRHHFLRPATVATVPIGYADGVPRRLFQCGGEVLIGGVRRPIVGVVTMDQLMVDCGDDSVAVGDEVILIGTQGDQTITANEWGDKLGTIGYEIVCAISVRIARRSM